MLDWLRMLNNAFGQIARGQATQLQTENARLKKAVSEVTSQTMAVNSRHLDAASKLRETIAQLTEKSEKSAKDCEVAEKLSSDLSNKVAELEKKNAELVEKASTSEQAKQGNAEMERQCKKVIYSIHLSNILILMCLCSLWTSLKSRARSWKKLPLSSQLVLLPTTPSMLK